MDSAAKRLRTFYILILTQTFSLIGSRISGLAIGIYVFNETGNATPLTMVAFFSALPSVVASSISGVLADRWDRRYVMAIADIGQAFGTLVLLVSFASGDFQLWHLYVVTFVQAIFGVFQGPAFSASITLLIPDNHRDRANAIQQLTGPAAGIFAPLVAGFIFAWVGVNGAILIDLVTFLVATAVVLSIHIPRPEQSDIGRAMQGSIWQEYLGGLKYLYSQRILLTIVLYISSLNFLISGAATLGTPYILARTGSETTLGFILSITNLGAIVGGVFVSVWGGTRPRMYTIMPAMVAIGLFLSMAGMAQTTPMLALAYFLFLIPMPIINALFMSIMQTKIPPDIQGRIFSVMGQFSLLLTPLSYLLVGPLADRVFEPAVGTASWDTFAPFVGNAHGAGMGLIMVIGGISAALLSVVMFMIPSVRRMESILPDYTPEPSAEPLEDEALAPA